MVILNTRAVTWPIIWHDIYDMPYDIIHNTKNINKYKFSLHVNHINLSWALNHDQVNILIKIDITR